MVRTGMLIAAAALLLVPAAAGAQEKESGRIEIRRAPRGADEVFRVLTNRRVRLGVNVDLQNQASDTLGARLEGVTPGGPADQAGLRAGDIITKLDGKSLVTAEPPAGVKRSMPGMRLIELAAQLEPNDTISVEYLRNGRRSTATLVTAEEAGGTFALGAPGAIYYRRGPEGMMVDLPRNLERPFTFWVGSPLGELELAPINADLGQYFGVSEGVLVIDVPEDSELGLRGGDVVLSVDGREPSSPQHLLRILRSYEPGENIRLEIQRNRRRETVTARMPGR